MTIELKLAMNWKRLFTDRLARCLYLEGGSDETNKERVFQALENDVDDCREGEEMATVARSKALAQAVEETFIGAFHVTLMPPKNE